MSLYIYKNILTLLQNEYTYHPLPPKKKIEDKKNVLQDTFYNWTIQFSHKPNIQITI